MARSSTIAGRRIAVKRPVRSKPDPKKRAARATPAETLIVDVTDQPAPGIVVITEFEAVVMDESSACPEHPEGVRTDFPPSEDEGRRAARRPEVVYP